MITFSGMTVYTTPAKLVNLRHTAPVVVDIHAFASDDRRQHDASLFLMRHRFDVVGVDDICSNWELCGVKGA